MKKLLNYVLILLVMIIPFTVSAKDSEKVVSTTVGDPINLYVFFGDGCPHCEHLLTYLGDLEEDENYNYMFNVVKYEVWNDADNAALMSDVAEALGTTASGVPFYVVGDYYNSGFPDITSTDKSVKQVVTSTTDELKAAIKTAYEGANAETVTYTDIVAAVGEGNMTGSKDDAKSSQANDVIGYIILGVTAIIVIAIIFGRTSTKDEEETEVEEAAEEVEEEVVVEKPKKTTKKPATKTTAAKKSTSTAKKTTASKTTTTKKAAPAKKATTAKKTSTSKASTAKKSTAKKTTK